MINISQLLLLDLIAMGTFQFIVAHTLDLYLSEAKQNFQQISGLATRGML